MLPSFRDKTAYGKGLADETKAAFEALGGKVSMYEAYTAGEKDYTALVSKLKQGQDRRSVCWWVTTPKQA